MTASSSSRPPFPTIATKTSSTTQSSQLSAVADSKLASAPRSSSRVPPSTKSRQDALGPDPTSERTTLSLIRRTLVADGSHGTDSRASPTPIEGVLPPLTSSNEVDVQLYAIVAIVIRDFVNSWYSKITPDRGFVDEVIQIIAHCSRALEQRIRQIDITELILDEVPVLIERHIVGEHQNTKENVVLCALLTWTSFSPAYRTATTAQAALQYGESPRRIYHALNPHPALDPSLTPDDRRNYESAYRQILIQGALAVLLPTEDLASACLRTLVSDIIADLILGQSLADKVCEPWFLHGTVSKVVEIVTSPTTHASAANAVVDKKILHSAGRRSRLEKFGLLSSNTADQEGYSSDRHQSSLSAWFWRLLQYAFIAYQSLRFILVGMAHAHHLPRRICQHHVDVSTSSSSSSFSHLKFPVSSTRRVSGTDSRSPRAVINYRIFSCISTMLDLSVRMPWLESSLGFWQHILSTGPGRYGAPNSTLDKFLYHTISTRLFSPSLLPPLLLQIRALIFPNNALGPAPPAPPTPEEALLIRSKAASDILSLIPKSVARIFFAISGDNDAQANEEIISEIEEAMLGWTDDAELNRYLIYAILEHVLLKLVPEIKDETTSELLAERGVLLSGNQDGDGAPAEKDPEKELGPG
ncbi:uncharacterized protein Z518_07943 [Rhinocladiella mackenziei CBS 650.93]|uniref:PXA domain-containing protein n=1 Tax=Rhinocladiella mackenziei CBS 650.93 TaxID=1442369 RepID=A0A0D2I849_9EURO|nr:uncharacterized protein Z518_07943 [Rhinocladiella mackenziei CBS 650.93]KIX02004.1 hypothetical protein Z518_07943 [Rhinocladiella mackenziei CBS 650.93]